MLKNFNKPVEFIHSVNELIWNQKQIGIIYECFKHNVLIHVYGRSIYGRDQLMEDVIDLLAGFPDLQRRTEEIIWAVDGKDGLYVSERWSWTGHAKGYTIYGEPTGKEVSCNGITNYYIHNGYIIEVWHTEDAISIPGQMEIKEDDAVKHLLDSGRYPFFSNPTSGENVRLKGEFPPEDFGENNGRFSDIEYLVRKNMYDIYNRRMFGMIKNWFHQEFAYHGPNGREIVQDADLYVQDKLALFQVFPDLCIQMNDFYYLFDTERKQYYVAYRWTIIGTHYGRGMYGSATGKRIYLPGITHQVIKDDKVLEEWTSYDELSLKCELFAANYFREQHEKIEIFGEKSSFDNENFGG